jgi:uncharacterized protein (UPF0333 family)
MKKKLQTGFAHTSALLLVLVVVIVALIGYKVAKDHSASTVASTTTPLAAQQIQTIKSTSDLTKVGNTLNKENVDGDLNSNSFNQDVNTLL